MRSLFASVLAAAFLFCLGCGETASTETSGPPQKPSVTKQEGPKGMVINEVIMKPKKN